MRFFAFTLSLLLANHTAFASGTNDNINVGTSTSSTNSTGILQPEKKSGEVLIYPLDEMLEKIENVTPKNLEDITEMLPSALFFLLDYHLKTSPGSDQAYRTNTILTTLYGYLFLIEMVPVDQISSDTVNLIKSILDRVSGRNSLSKKQNAFFKKNFKNTHKIKNVKASDLYKIFFSDTQDRIENAIAHYKSVICATTDHQPSGRHLFTRDALLANHKLLEAGAYFNAQESISKLWSEFLTAQHDTTSAEYEHLVTLLRFSTLTNTAHNYACLLNKQGDYFGQQRWTSFIDPFAKQEIHRFDSREDQDAFVKAMFGEKGMEGFFETATKTTLTTEEFLVKLKDVVETENPLPSDLLKYAEKLYEVGRYTEAKEWGIKAGDAGEEKGYLIAVDCAALRKQNEDILSCFGKITNQTLITPYHHHIWGQALYVLKRFDEANLHFLKALKNYPEAYFFLGEIENDIEKKEKLYKLALLKMEPGNVNIAVAHQRLGLMSEAKKDYETSRLHFQKGVENGAEGMSFYIGRSFHTEEKYAEAIPHFLLAGKSKNQGHKWLKSESFVYAAKCYMKLDDTEQAERFFKKAVKAGANYALLDLGKMAEHRGDHGSAIHYYGRAVNKHVKTAHHHLALLYAKIGQKNTTQLNYIIADIAGDIDEDDVEIENDNAQDDNEYVDAINSKRYQRMLAKIQQEIDVEAAKTPEEHRTNNEKTLDDLNITCSSENVRSELVEHEQRVKDLLYGLVNGIRAGHFETLKNYKNRCSMRITKGDRLVFDIVEGSLNDEQGIKAIVIVSAKGHYKNVTDTEYTDPAENKVSWNLID